MEIKELISKIDKFSKDRQWQQFHTPKNLAMAVSIEASELLELFLWTKDSECFEGDNDDPLQVKNNVTKENLSLEKIKDEIADIQIYLLRLISVLGLDPTEIVLSKMKKNAKKYPVELCKGKSDKYSRYTISEVSGED